MNIRDLKPAGQFAAQYGVKSLVYGNPGVGKTPCLNTAPRPIMLITEPGMLSMRGSEVPAFSAFTNAHIDDFFKWWFTSNEAKNFDTFAADSVSQLAEIKLAFWLDKKRDGRAAYGEMSEEVMSIMTGLYYQQQKHTYLICKQSVMDVQGVTYRRPYFPGKDLNIKVPHMYDLIMHMGIASIPNVGMQKAMRTAEAMDCLARDRSGKLAEYEPCDLTYIFNKAMG